MIDTTDKKTIDMLPDAPKKRGRPSTGTAMSAAQRKRKSRRMADKRVWSGNPAEIAKVPTLELAIMVAKMIENGYTNSGEEAMNELNKRYRDCHALDAKDKPYAKELRDSHK